MREAPKDGGGGEGVAAAGGTNSAPSFATFSSNAFNISFFGSFFFARFLTWMGSFFFFFSAFRSLQHKT